MYVLDTDHMSLLDRGTTRSALQLRERLAPLDSSQVATTIVTYEEQTRGWLSYAARSKAISSVIESYSKLSGHLENYREIRALEFEQSAAVQFQRLQKLRLKMGTMDLRIAAIVLANDAVLLSRNSVDFMKVPGLRFEDWSTPPN